MIFNVSTHALKNWVMSFLLILPAFSGASENIEQLQQRREKIREWASICKEEPFYGTFSSTHGHCDHGDLMIFAGLSCLAAHLAGDSETEAARCRDVELSQSPTGQWWRGPNKVDIPIDGSSFSRDQLRGIIAYMIVNGVLTRNYEKRVEAQTRFLAWLKWLKTSPGNNMCIDGRGFFSSCHLRESSLNMIILTLIKMGIADKAKAVLGANSSLWKKLVSAKDSHENLWNDIEMKFIEKGYPLHLKASTVVFHRVLGFYKDSSAGRSTIRRMVKGIQKKDPQNPLFEFLNFGATDDVTNKVIARCSTERPPYDRGQGDWQWQRDTSEQKWREANGWDCIYMINLLIAHKNQKFSWVW